VLRWSVIALLASCGRFDFGAQAPPDAAPDAHVGPVQPLIHNYPLAGDFLDTFGGPALSGHGGTFVATGYKFDVNQGLSVANVMPADVYTIDFTFQLTAVDNYRKVVDFKALGSDAGLYVVNSMLQFVVIPVTGCPGSDCFTSPAVFMPDTSAQLTLTRDATGTVTAYVNRMLQFSFSDGGSVGAFDAAGETVELFIDDNSTGFEASAGIVRDVRIYDTALPANQIPPSPQ
jgi:hypothetical protein